MLLLLLLLLLDALTWFEQLLSESENVTCLDLTGGAPELNSQFR